MSRLGSFVRAGLLAAFVALLVGGCLPAPGTTGADSASQLYTIFVGVAAVVAAIVWGLATWMLASHFVRRLRGRPPQGEPPQTKGSNLLEITWTAIPALTVLVLFGLTVVAVDKIQAVSPSPGARIDVTAFRWGWRIAYPDAGVEYVGAGLPGPDIGVPVGEAVQFTLRSNDVVHSFFVPRFLFKRDAIPSHTTVFDFTVQAAGTYRGQCAEFCGIGHSQMAFSIVAMPPDQFRAWLAQQPRATASAGPSGAAASPGLHVAPVPSGPATLTPAAPGPSGSIAASPSSLASPSIPGPSPSSGGLAP
jgi:cytochrome c oxidase subunit II